jgi:vancomycin permeability regulator SanA
MSNTPVKKDKLIVTIFFILQLFNLYVIKYNNQNLSLNYFSILKTGNLINLFIYTGIISGIYILSKKGSLALSKKQNISFLIISYLLLLLAFIFTRLKIISSSIYFYDQPGDKVFTGFLFLSHFFSLLFFLVFIWSRIFIKKKTSILKTIVSSILLIVLLMFFILIYIDNVSYTSGRWALKKNNKNVAVVLGAAVWSGNIPSPTLSSRVDKALNLLNQGFAGRIVLTGGKAPGELSESIVAFEYARMKGVDTSKVLIENVTSSTSDQIRWISNEIQTSNNFNADIIIVSDAYHLPRAIEISKFFNLDIKVAESTHKQEVKDKIFTKIRECIAVFNFWNFAL